MLRGGGEGPGGARGARRRSGAEPSRCPVPLPQPLPLCPGSPGSWGGFGAPLRLGGALAAAVGGRPVPGTLAGPVLGGLGEPGWGGRGRRSPARDTPVLASGSHRPPSCLQGVPGIPGQHPVPRGHRAVPKECDFLGSAPLERLPGAAAAGAASSESVWALASLGPSRTLCFPLPYRWVFPIAASSRAIAARTGPGWGWQLPKAGPAPARHPDFPMKGTKPAAAPSDLAFCSDFGSRRGSRWWQKQRPGARPPSPVPAAARLPGPSPAG